METQIFLSLNKLENFLIYWMFNGIRTLFVSMVILLISKIFVYILENLNYLFGLIFLKSIPLFTSNTTKANKCYFNKN